MQFTGCLDNFTYSRIAKLDNLTCLNINEMVMLSALVSSFKLSNILAKLVLDHKIAFKQKFDSIVKRCTANPVVFILHKNIEGLNIKMAGASVDFIENCKSFRSLPVSFSFQVFSEYLLDSLSGILTNHIWSDFNY